MTVTDWKSQAHILSQQELENHDQLTMYCWLASKLHPNIKTFSTRIWYLRYGFYAETRRTEEDLENFERALMIQEQKILETSSWDPVPGKHCGYCDVKSHCPLTQSKTEHIITREQAVEAAKQITVMEASVKELKAKLKDYVKVNDSITIGDWTWGFKAKESKIWNIEEVVEVLIDHGHALAEVASLDARKFKKLIKNASPELESALSKIEKVRVRTEFRGYKQGDAETEDEVD